MTEQERAAAHLAKLPPLCYALLEMNAPGHRIVLIKAGESGHYVSDYDLPSLSLDYVREMVIRLNDRLGVTANQQEAMSAGSMFGWHVPGADPDGYTNH